MQCKYLLLNIPVEKISSFDEIESVDEAADKLDKSLEPFEGRVDKIPPEVEFWGHCSNLQVWAENNYDTRLLHRNLAFPLLKKLSDVGDLIAKKVFKDEIIRRLREGNAKVIAYLIKEQYFRHSDDEELETMLFDTNLNLFEKIFNVLEIDTTDEILCFIIDVLMDIKLNPNLLNLLVSESNLNFIKNLLLLQNYSGYEFSIREQIDEIFNQIKNKNNELSNEFYKIVFNLFYLDSDIILLELIHAELFEVLKDEDYQILFNNPRSKLKDNIRELIKKSNPKYLSEDIITLLIILCKKIGKTEVFQFIKSLEQEIKIRLQQGMGKKLENLKLENKDFGIHYHYLDKSELEKYLLNS